MFEALVGMGGENVCWRQLTIPIKKMSIIAVFTRRP